MKKSFKMFDTDNSGDIEVFELIKMFYKNGVSEDACKDLSNTMDVNKDGKISYEEFSEAMKKII